MAYPERVMQTAQKRETGPTFAFETECRRSGYRVIAGIDEAGRGALAGPVVAAAVVLPADMSEEHIGLIDDSKKLTINQREYAFDMIRTYGSAHGIGTVPAGQIDELGIVPATKLAMRDAIRAIRWRIDFLLIDAVTNIGIATPSKSIIRGDSKSLSIAAASIVAKVTRDRIMSDDLEAQYPGYGFAQHKGYGTAEHMNALQNLGPCPVHRRSFKPVAQLIADKSWAVLSATSASNIAGRSEMSLPDGLGLNVEDAAANHLRQLGYRIIDRNYKTRHGEVDIIAKVGPEWVFVEVKGRNSTKFGRPVEALTPAKLNRIENVALGYLAAEVGSKVVDWRIDFVGVTRSPDGRSLDFEIVRNAHY